MADQQAQLRSWRSQNMKARHVNIINNRKSTNLNPFENAAAFEACLDNKPILSRQLIEKVVGYIEKIRKGKQSENEQPVRLRHVLGDGCHILNVPLHPADVVDVMWLSTFRLIESEGKQPGYIISTMKSSYGGFDGTVMLKPDDTNHPLRQEIARMPDPPELTEMEALKTIFLASKFWASVTERLDALTVPVKNIVCMGLGSVFFRGESREGYSLEKSKLSYRTSGQHLLACSCSDYLSSRYAKKAFLPRSPIPIVSRDPSYEFKDMHLLSRLYPPITVVSDPYQYLSITPNTLVIAINLPVFVPIYEMVADICFPSGPAAIICNEIFEQEWHKDGLIACLDQRTPRVNKMLAQYDVQWLGKGLEYPDDQVSDYERGIDRWGQDQFLYARRE